ncbi:basic proline-rich protein-like [Choloepus didactylus]|uniref:basic proline-rich protein-like n=1 Tax=Choloepus didactylus TaxID=27675 RepID=UPI00189D12FC|nr:basic proline-rich protein-like [Choloepus didactylus]
MKGDLAATGAQGGRTPAPSSSLLPWLPSDAPGGQTPGSLGDPLPVSLASPLLLLGAEIPVGTVDTWLGSEFSGDTAGAALVPAAGRALGARGTEAGAGPGAASPRTRSAPTAPPAGPRAPLPRPLVAPPPRGPGTPKRRPAPALAPRGAWDAGGSERTAPPCPRQRPGPGARAGRALTGPSKGLNPKAWALHRIPRRGTEPSMRADEDGAAVATAGCRAAVRSHPADPCDRAGSLKVTGFQERCLQPPITKDSTGGMRTAWTSASGSPWTRSKPRLLRAGRQRAGPRASPLLRERETESKATCFSCEN